MTHRIAKRFKLAKHGGTFLLTLALSVGANAMDPAQGQKQTKAPAKSDCAPVVRTHTDDAPTYDKDTLRTGQKVEKQRTITDVVTTVTTERWTAADYESWSEEEIIPEGVVNTWTQVKPAKVCKVEQQCAPTQVVEVKAPVCDSKPAVQTVAQAEPCAKAAEPCAVKTEPMQTQVCDKPAQAQKSVQSGPCLDVAPVCSNTAVDLACVRGFAQGPFTQIQHDDWFDKNRQSCGRSVYKVKFGNKWSHGDHRAEDWSNTKYSNFRWNATKLRSINADHSYWNNWDVLNGKWHDVEVQHATLENMLFQGTPNQMFKMKSCKFSDSHLKNVIFRSVKFDNSNKKARRKTSFHNTRFENVLFENVDFAHVTFKGAIFMPGTQFGKCGASMNWQKFINARIWMGEGQTPHYVTWKTVDQLKSSCQQGFGYDQMKQWSSPQQQLKQY